MKIASIDKHPIIRSGLSVFLKNNYNDVTILEAGCIDSFLEMYQNDSPDVVIIGLAEEAQGIDMVVLKAVMNTNPNSAFIVYAGRPQYQLAMSCFRAGVKGYLLKSNDLGELIKCMETVMQGGCYLCNEFRNMSLN
jgi:DNA-binding NarL/FixJ family response regulator